MSTTMSTGVPSEGSERPKGVIGMFSGQQHERAGPAKPRCQVEGCEADLTGETAKPYYRRSRVCGDHMKCWKVLVSKQECRYCQQCHKFHPLSEFDEAKRSCRWRLKKRANLVAAAARSPATKHRGAAREWDPLTRSGSGGSAGKRFKWNEPHNGLMQSMGMQRAPSHHLTLQDGGGGCSSSLGLSKSLALGIGSMPQQPLMLGRALSTSDTFPSSIRTSMLELARCVNLSENLRASAPRLNSSAVQDPTWLSGGLMGGLNLSLDPAVAARSQQSGFQLQQQQQGRMMAIPGGTPQGLYDVAGKLRELAMQSSGLTSSDQLYARAGSIPKSQSPSAGCSMSEDLQRDRTGAGNIAAPDSLVTGRGPRQVLASSQGFTPVQASSWDGHNMVQQHQQRFLSLQDAGAALGKNLGQALQFHGSNNNLVQQQQQQGQQYIPQQYTVVQLLSGGGMQVLQQNQDYSQQRQPNSMVPYAGHDMSHFQSLPSLPRQPAQMPHGHEGQQQFQGGTSFF